MEVTLDLSSMASHFNPERCLWLVVVDIEKLLRAELWSFALDCTDMKQCFMVAKSQTYLNARDRGREGGRALPPSERIAMTAAANVIETRKGNRLTELRHKKVYSLRLSRVIMSCLVAISTIAYLLA